MARSKQSSKLPVGVTERKDRPGLYRLSVMIEGKRYSENFRPDENLTQRQLQSVLQKQIDAYRERVERGALRGQVTDKSTLDECAEWYFGTAKMIVRESTLQKSKYTYERYIAPEIGSVKVKNITTPMVSQLLADLLDHGGGKTYYTALPSFIEDVAKMRGDRPLQQFLDEIGVSENSYYRLRKPNHETPHHIAVKMCEHFNVPLEKAFIKKKTQGPLSAGMVSSITYTLSAILTALVRADVLTRNPVLNATKPRVGEAKRGAYLDTTQLPVFLAALESIKDDSVRICLMLCLQLGLRSGEARALRWEDIDYKASIVHIDHNAVVTSAGLVIGEPKTKRSVRKLPLSPYLQGLLLEHKETQAHYARSIGSAWTEMGLVCPNQTGGIMERSRLHTAVKSIVKANPSLPRDLHPHSLRHSFVTLLIASGLDVVTVASLAGDTVDIIVKTYAHALKEREAAAMDKIGGVFAQINAAPAEPILRLLATSE